MLQQPPSRFEKLVKDMEAVLPYLKDSPIRKYMAEVLQGQQARPQLLRGDAGCDIGRREGGTESADHARGVEGHEAAGHLASNLGPLPAAGPGESSLLGAGSGTVPWKMYKVSRLQVGSGGMQLLGRCEFHDMYAIKVCLVAELHAVVDFLPRTDPAPQPKRGKGAMTAPSVNAVAMFSLDWLPASIRGLMPPGEELPANVAAAVGRLEAEAGRPELQAGVLAAVGEAVRACQPAVPPGPLSLFVAYCGPVKRAVKSILVYDEAMDDMTALLFGLWGWFLMSMEQRGLRGAAPAGEAITVVRHGAEPCWIELGPSVAPVSAAEQ